MEFLFDMKKLSKEAVSVIVPTYNAETTIGICLSNILAQHQEPFEIIVVNDASTDNTVHFVKQLQQKSKKIRLITLKKNSGAGIARNVGAHAAKTELLVFLDADCVPHKEWLNNLVKNLGDRDIAATASQYNASVNKSFIAQYAFHELTFRDNKKKGFLDAASSCNFACRKKDFLSIGGFSLDRIAEPAEDIDFFFKLSKRGKILFVDTARVGHYFRDTLMGYLHQQKEYSRSAMYLFLKTYRQKLFTKNTLHDKTAYLEILITLLMPIGIVASFIFPLLLVFLLFFYTSILLLLNMPFLTYVTEHDGCECILRITTLIVLRDVAWGYGVIQGLIQSGTNYLNKARI